MDMAETPGLSETPDGVMEKENCTAGIFLSNQLGNFLVRNSGLVHA